MKILAFADTHLDEKVVKKIIKKSKQADFVICAGDVSWFGQGLKEILKDLSKNIKKDIYIVHGNHESPSEIRKAIKGLKNIHFMHKKTLQVENYKIFFWGGGGFELRNKRFEEATKRFQNKLKKGEEVILVTHGPPYKTKLDHLEWAGHVGSKSIRAFIRKVKPMLHICGHLHENTGRQQVLFKKTLIINPEENGNIIEA
tara:strand:- start:2249 stop:2848 length:600 start_codon:yes stop_codon:yes gene_type:complete